MRYRVRILQHLFTPPFTFTGSFSFTYNRFKLCFFAFTLVLIFLISCGIINNKPSDISEPNKPSDISEPGNIKKRVDVIFIINTDNPMENEIKKFEQKLNDLYTALTDSDIDTRIILLTDGSAVCPPAPLTSGTCPAGNNPPNYYMINYTVSNKVFAAIKNKATTINSLLRPGSVVHMVELSNKDEDTLTSASFADKIKDLSGPLAKARFHAYVNTNTPDLQCNNVPKGNEYIKYAVTTGGEVYDLCKGDLNDFINKLAARIKNDNNTGVTRTYFPTNAFYYENITNAEPDGNSDTMITELKNAGGWGSEEMKIDFSLNVETASSELTKTEFTKKTTYYEPDCDTANIPLPPDGALENETGYTCSLNGDCHLIVWSPYENRLYEAFKANLKTDLTLEATCLAVWDTGTEYPENGRGEYCVSANGSGMPIAPLLVTADEVASGEINHAIRFLLPGSRIRNYEYIHPATTKGAATGGTDMPPMGAHFRLRADYPIDDLPSTGAKVIARAMQRYGMFLADSGNFPITVQSDKNSVVKWDGLLAIDDLSKLNVDDFEVIDHGLTINYTNNCSRTQISE